MHRDNLAEWIWNVGSEKQKEKKVQTPIVTENKNDLWIKGVILSAGKGKTGYEYDEAIDNRLHLLREWLRLLKHQGGLNGQVVLIERRLYNNRIKTITHDIRNFEAFCRFKEKNYGNSVLRKIL